MHDFQSPARSMPTPRSLYVHIPFCARRCNYCNFTLIAGREDLIEAFLNAIEIEIERLDNDAQLDTLYFGGGTPNLLSQDQFARLYQMILRRLSLSPVAEVTVEANPELITEQQCSHLRSMGVNRLSMGGQSFRDEKLQLLDREHDGRQLRKSIELAKEYFPRIAVDLIFATPNETLTQWQEDLKSIGEMSVGHISTYGLTVEKGTRLFSDVFHQRTKMLDEQLELEMYNSAIEFLTSIGYRHYEVSSFCKPEQKSRHNSVYWRGLPWWGIGPGAAEFSGGYRRTNHRSTTEYIKRIRNGIDYVSERERLSNADFAIERLVFGLRQMEGIDWHETSQLFPAVLLPSVNSLIEEHLRLGFLNRAGANLRLSARGLRLSDALWPDYFALIQDT